jgi:hypothetical protein
MHNELNGLDSSPKIIRVIKARKMRGSWHVTRMAERRGGYGFLLRKLD